MCSRRSFDILLLTYEDRQEQPEVLWHVTTKLAFAGLHTGAKFALPRPPPLTLLLLPGSWGNGASHFCMECIPSCMQAGQAFNLQPSCTRTLLVQR